MEQKLVCIDFSIGKHSLTARKMVEKCVHFGTNIIVGIMTLWAGASSSMNLLIRNCKSLESKSCCNALVSLTLNGALLDLVADVLG